MDDPPDLYFTIATPLKVLPLRFTTEIVPTPLELPVKVALYPTTSQVFGTPLKLGTGAPLPLLVTGAAVTPPVVPTPEDTPTLPFEPTDPNGREPVCGTPDAAAPPVVVPPVAVRVIGTAVGITAGAGAGAATGGLDAAAWRRAAASTALACRRAVARAEATMECPADCACLTIAVACAWARWMFCATTALEVAGLTVAVAFVELPDTLSATNDPALTTPATANSSTTAAAAMSAASSRLRPVVLSDRFTIARPKVPSCRISAAL